MMFRKKLYRYCVTVTLGTEREDLFEYYGIFEVSKVAGLEEVKFMRKNAVFTANLEAALKPHGVKEYKEEHIKTFNISFLGRV